MQFRKQRKTKSRELQKEKLEDHLQQTPKVQTQRFPLGILYYQGSPTTEIKSKYTFSPKDQVTIGTKSNCSISIQSPRLSTKHALIKAEEQGYVLYDLASRTGVMVNNKKISRQVLRDGDVIKLDSYSFQFSQIERRKYPRVTIKRPLKFLIYGENVKFEEESSSTEELSLGGLRIRWKKPLPVNTVIEAMVELPDYSFEIWGRVRWNKKVPSTENGKNYWSGISFTDISEDDRFKLNNFLAKHLSGEIAPE